MTIEQLRLSRQVLSGRDPAGQKRHSGMFDPEVISLAHGEGVRRPHPSVVAAGIASLLDRSCAALDNYLFLRRHAGLHAAIAQEFTARGVPNLIGFDLQPATGQLQIRVRDPQSFYAAWPEQLLRSGVAVHEIRSESRSLRQIFEHMTS